jgi:hypothetical protein
MTDQDRRDEMIGIKVYPDTKEEWEQAVKNDPDASGQWKSGTPCRP